MKQLEANKVYYIDGGHFQAIYDELTERFALWTYLGLAGYVIGRTGFEISSEGKLHARIFDFETDEQVVFEIVQLTVDDLQEVDVSDFDAIPK